MLKLDYKVSGSVITSISSQVVASNSIDLWEVGVIFSNEWDGFTKTLVCHKGDETYSFILDDDDEVKANKHLNLSSGRWSVSILGVSSTGVANATIPITLEVEESGYISGVTIPEPSPDVYEQLLTMYSSVLGELDATSLLEKIKTVDGVGSGLDADTVGGLYPSELGGITVEVDPTVPAWAKEEEKPTYTAVEVGAISTSKLTNVHSTATDEVYTAQYCNLAFAPIVFSTDYYVQKTSDLSGSLVETNPTTDDTNYMVTTNATNSTIDWNGTQKLTIMRVLANNITLGRGNTIAFTMPFATSRNANLEFGARMFVDGVQIASNQALGSITTVGSSSFDTVKVFQAEIIIDLLEIPTVYMAGQVITVEFFKRQELPSPLTTRYFCSVVVNGEDRDILVRINSGNVAINTSRLADESVTLSKLSLSLQDTFGTIDKSGSGNLYLADDGTYKEVNGYEPDATTITLNGSSQLQVADSLLDTINSVGTDITVADATTITQVLQPNKLYNIDASALCTTLTLSLATPITGILSHYYVMVKCGATPPTLTAISGVNTITLTANKTTEISILKGHAFFSAY